jgi:hypothetical protein
MLVTTEMVLAAMTSTNVPMVPTNVVIWPLVTTIMAVTLVHVPMVIVPMDSTALTSMNVLPAIITVI